MFTFETFYPRNVSIWFGIYKLNVIGIYMSYVTIQHQKRRTFSSSSENEKKKTDSTKPKAVLSF